MCRNSHWLTDPKLPTPVRCKPQIVAGKSPKWCLSPFVCNRQTSPLVNPGLYLSLMHGFYRSVAFVAKTIMTIEVVQAGVGLTGKQGRAGQCNLHDHRRVRLTLFKSPRSKGAMQIPAASTPPFDVSGRQIIVVITVAVSNRWSRPNMGPCCDSQLVVWHLSYPTSERHPTIREAVWADKVIWLGGVLSSAPTVGYLRLLGILCAHPHTSPYCDNSVTVFSVSKRLQACCTVNNFSSGCHLVVI